MAIIAPEFYARDRSAWRAWLSANHATQKSVWLVYDKGKNRTITYDEIVEEALCFGWVDSVAGKVDDARTKLYISQRKPRSAWAKTNKARIADLTQRGLMRPAGLHAVAIAQANGAWDALNASDQMLMPPELAELLAANPSARAFYDTMPPSSHRIILEWIYAARTEATRIKRIQETVELAAQGIKAHHYRQ